MSQATLQELNQMTLQQLDPVKLQQLVDRAEISDTVIRYGTGLDLQDWELYRTCFTDDIEADISDFTGKAPFTIKADEWVDLGRRFLKGLKTQHVSTNHVITFQGPDEATCVSHLFALHHQPNDKGASFFNMHGYYTNTLVRTPQGWKIRKIKQTITWNEGNPQLIDPKS